ncbi:TipAS antibiotic-recognition domain-containing protein [Microbacterium sp. SLBN-146]|uniref:MerR family transcriptional regulator n=1 Tax=Microbacterium sp. SLBN-146 TaxID=2768457 RepID=UPI001153EDE0|nr:TipAS antibiotic-recognition domain-containing protein [Microbacterium sp. SLBN-146]TQJ30528.1 DNA-binding transcriptional MerR regulator [Microbacterium sp. SLBN-146]
MNTTSVADQQEWSIQEIARLTGTTSRTLRHYDDIGLLPPSSTGRNGYRHYDAAALLRLQRILLLRDLGLGLPAIGEVLSRHRSEAEALERHLEWLRGEQTRLARQIASVESTITAVRGGERLMAEKMFDGFDHTAYKAEVEERWGADAYGTADRWWRGLSRDDRSAFQERGSALSRDWIAAAESAQAPDGPEAQALAERHVQWLASAPGTPRGADLAGYLTGLGDMYVADQRFGAHYATRHGGTEGAGFVRDALRVYAERNLQDG